MNGTLNICHLDDNAYDLRKLADALANYDKLKIKTHSFQSPHQLMEHIGNSAISTNLFLLDIALGGESSDGLSVCTKLSKLYPNSVILMYSGIESSEITKQAHKFGAHGFIFKSTDENRLVNDIISSYRIAHKKFFNQKISTIPDVISSKYGGSTFTKIAESIPSLLQSAIQTIHIKGETGVGKEMVADLLQASIDKHIPFMRLNCASFNGSTIESELFGHAKGAFTGANKDKAGIFEAANGGWVFLDEVGSLSLETQAKMLRLLENSEIKRLGENRIRKVKVRIISATNENIELLAENGVFREDFRQRLIGKIIEVAPLRNRQNEVPEIISKICKSLENGPYTISAAAANLLGSLQWEKGNIRELKNCLREMTAYHVDHHLSTELIPQRFLRDSDESHNANKDRKLVRKEPQHRQNAIVINIPNKSTNVKFNSLSNELLWNIIQIYSSTLKRKSIRNYAKITGLSRRVLTNRLNEIVVEGIAPLKEVKSHVEKFETTILKRA